MPAQTESHTESPRAPLGALIVYGPQGCGKTRNAEALRKAFGAKRIVDDWWPGDPAPRGALLLTHADASELPPEAVSFDAAMARVRGGA